MLHDSRTIFAFVRCRTGGTRCGWVGNGAEWSKVVGEDNKMGQVEEREEVKGVERGTGFPQSGGGDKGLGVRSIYGINPKFWRWEVGKVKVGCQKQEPRQTRRTNENGPTEPTKILTFEIENKQIPNLVPE